MRHIFATSAALAVIAITGLAQPLQDDSSNVLRLIPILTDVYRPARIKSNQAGDLFVLSRGDHSIIVYDRRQRFLRRIGIIGQGPGELHGPRDFAIAPDGTIWVADRQNDRVQVFTADGHVIGQFSVEAPSSLAVLRGGAEVAVVGDRDEHLMRIFTRTGELLRAVDGLVPTPAKDPKMQAFFNRGRITADAADSIYYMFLGASPPRIRRYSNAGEVLDVFPYGESVRTRASEVWAKQNEAVAAGELSIYSTLNAASIDPATGHLWVVPTALEVYVYAPNGTKLATYRWREVNGELHGAQDLYLTKDGEGFLISRGRCFRFTLPGVPSGR